MQYSYDSAKSGFSKAFLFDKIDISRFLNEKKQGKQYAIYAERSGIFLDGSKHGVKAYMSIKIGNEAKKTATDAEIESKMMTMSTSSMVDDSSEEDSDGD